MFYAILSPGFLYVSVIRVLQENHTVKQGSNISIRTLVNIFVRIFGGQMCYKALTALLKCVKCVHLTWFCRVQHQIRFQREYNFLLYTNTNTMDSEHITTSYVLKCEWSAHLRCCSKYIMICSVLFHKKVDSFHDANVVVLCASPHDAW